MPCRIHLTVGAVLLCACIPTSARARVFTLIVGKGNSFQAATYNDSLLFPPDTNGSVGPNDLVMHLNGRYRVFPKYSAGTPSFDSTLNTFWSTAGQTVFNRAFDPRTVYDPLSQRWYASSADASRSANSRYLLAVSRTANPLDGWTALSIPADRAGQLWTDYPMLGFDRDGVYLSSNLYTVAGDISTRRQTIAIPKSDLLSPTPTAAHRVTFDNLSNVNSPTLAGGMTAIATDGKGLADRPYDLLTTSGFPSSSGFARAQINGTFQTGLTLTSEAPVPVSFMNAGDTARQPSANRVETDRDRLSSPLVRVAGSYWGVQLRRSAAGDNVLRFFRFNADTFTLEQESTIGVPGKDLYYPSIAVNPSGRVVIGFNVSGPSAPDYIAAYAVVGDTVGNTTTFSAPLLLQDSSVAYYRTSSTTDTRNRWGDYSATGVDPADPNLFWTWQEVPLSTNTWAVRAAEVMTAAPGESVWKDNTSAPDYASPSRWLSGASPLPTDHVIFSRPSAAGFTVSFTSDAAAGQLSVRQGTTTFALAGHAYNVAGPLTIAEYQGTARLNVSNGSIAALSATVGGGASGPGGGSGTLSSSAAGSITVVGTLKVWPGGTLELAGGTVSAALIDLDGGTLTGAGALPSPLRLSAATVHVPTAAQTLATTGLVAFAGNTTKTGPGTWTVTGPIVSSLGSSLSVKAGRARLASDAGSALHLTVDAIGELASTQHLAALDVGPSAKVTLLAGADKLLRLGTLSITTGGRLDLADNDLIVENPTPDLVPLLAQAYHAGRWDLPGIQSSTASSSVATSLGYAYAADLGITLFDDEPVPPTALLVKFTRPGDANLDGVVDEADLDRLSTAPDAPADWSHGDFNYDGRLTPDDYALLSLGAAASTTPLAPVLPEPAPVLVSVLATLVSRRVARDRAVPTRQHTHPT